MEHNFQKNRGDVAIYIALLVMTIMLAGAVVLGSLLARQFRLGRSIIADQRAFYAANSGLEHVLFRLNKETPPPSDLRANPIEDQISYENSEPATYTSHGEILTTGSVCVYSSSEYQNNTGRLRSRGVGCPLE